LAEPWSTGVTRYRISPPRWPQGLRLKLALIADLHACEPWMGIERIEGIVEQTNTLRPDCILLLGDYVSGLRMGRYSHPLPHKVWAELLGRLRAPLGVHAVLGNHDWWEEGNLAQRRVRPPKACIALQEAGVPVLENESVRLEKNGVGFWLAGLGDQWAFTATDGRDDLDGTLRQVSDDAPVILMAHEPDIFPKVPERVAATVAGHTHGGQIRVLGYAPVVPSRYGDRYVYGHIVEKGRNLVVSGGLGCSGVPLRFGSPPEIVLVELSA
jgi:predicted MPP superfamily phosphohydrolase